MNRSLTNVLLVCLSIVAAVSIPLSDLEMGTATRQSQPNLAPPDLNINVGGTSVGRFMGDQYAWVVGLASTDKFENTEAVIGGAEQKNLPMYKSHRYGKLDAGTTPWGYDIPVAEPGTYGCTVHFAETDSTAFKNGERKFDLSIQGVGPASEFKNIDVYNETNGGMFVVLTKTAPEVVVTSILKVRVAKTAASPHGAFIAGITCERTGNLPTGTEPAATPADISQSPVYAPMGLVLPSGPVVQGKQLNLNAGGSAIGRFIADNPGYLRYGPSTVFSKKGHPIGGSEAINAPAMDTIRYGLNSDWGYSILMNSPGKWACTLHFAELIFSVKPGERVFHVQVQDQVFKNVDVMQGTAGAPFTTFTRTFDEVIVADSITIRFIQVKGNPFVNAVTCELGSPMTKEYARKLLASRAAGAGVKPPAPASAPLPAEPTLVIETATAPTAGPAQTESPTLAPPSTCNFVFCDGTSEFSVGKAAELPFTGKVCHKNGKRIGTVDESGEAYLQGGSPISKYAPTGLTQKYSPSFFKTSAIKSTSYVYSGIAHEVPQQNQGQFLNGRTWILPLEAYQVLNDKGHVTGEYVGGENDCIKFSTNF